MNKENNVETQTPVTNQPVAPVQAIDNNTMPAPAQPVTAPVPNSTPSPSPVSSASTPNANEMPALANSAPVAPAPAAPQVTASTPAPAPTNKPKVEDEVIYKIKEEKGGNIIGVIFFFAIIFTALFFLPKISDELSKFIPGINGISGPTVHRQSDEEPKPEEKPKTEEPEKEELLDLNGAVSNAVIDDIQLGNFVKDNNSGVNKLNFYILNNGNEAFTFNDSTKFYIDLYENDSYISSSLVYTFNDIAPKESIDFYVIINNDAYKRANKFKIVRKTKDDYKAIKLNKQEGDYKILTCTYGNNKVEYYFVDNYLEVIVDNYSESKTNVNYANDLEKYRNDASIYESFPSIDYNVIESTEGFNVKTKLDLEHVNDVDLKKLAMYKYFNYHKESKIISFEMISLGYTCS